MRQMKKHSRERGSAVTQTVLMAAVLIFIIMPVFSAVIEKYILMEKARVITDSVDMTNISAYNALSSAELGKVRIGAERSDILEIYRHILSINLRLNDDLEPQPDSVAEGCVEVLSLEIFSSDFPAHCPEGVPITRPAVHSTIRVPVRPSLYRGIILGMLGREYVDIIVHVDTEIPVNN
ncbi:MAG: hypothetical protein GX385_08990 [Clostridiaceae bacterium]|nr:hypothetical protein [Clostridiaceae bacterium]